MMWTRWFRFRSPDDFAAEVESHVAMETERLTRGGMNEDEARYAARRAFGNVTVSREQFREARTGAWFDTLMQDVRYGLRAMRRSPGFTGVAIASFAIGIGANTTMFGTIDTLLLRAPAHVVDADRIHHLYFQTPTPTGTGVAVPNQSYRTYAAVRDGAKSFEAVAAMWPTTVSSGRGNIARPVDAVLATSSFFELLGVRPAVGRFFSPSEERDENEHVAVIGYEMWRGQYAGDRGVLGRAIDVAGVPHIIVGVAPLGFTGVRVNRVDLWLPIGVATRLLDPRATSPTGGQYWLEIVAKRRAQFRAQQVANEVTLIYRDLYRGSPRYEATFAKSEALLAPIVGVRGPRSNAEAKISTWVGGVSLLVLLIASANVANLLLLRGLTRSREVALRLSLGATRGRILRQWLIEGLLLAGAGAVCALIIARWSAAAVQSFLLPQALPGSVLDRRVLGFTAVMALATGLIATLVPALIVARRNFAPLLGTGRTSSSPHGTALQRALIAGQVALASVLLIGAGLFVTSLRNVRAIDLGVDANRVLYVQLDLGPFRTVHHDPNARASANATYLELLERTRRLPGVVHASVTEGAPLAAVSAMAVRRRGAPPLVQGSPVPFWRAVGSDYFATVGTSLVRGRFFTAADHVAGAHVAIVDEATAKQYELANGGLDPCIYLGSDRKCTEVVGVVESTVAWQLTGDRHMVLYMPFEAWPSEAITLMLVRSSGDARELIPALRQLVVSAAPQLPWTDIRPFAEWLAPQLRPWRLGASMFTAYGVLALCLASVGLYGLLSYMVIQRSHEIGVRKALGAPDGRLIGEVLRGAMSMTAFGIAFGVAVALGAGRLISSQLYGISPRDPIVIVLCAGVLIVVTIIACLAPARRATKVDPIIALRAE